MGTRIALFRGINVGGKNALNMNHLVSHLQGLGLKNVRTYIQSGNAVFSCPDKVVPKLPDKIAATISENHGFSPRVLVLSLEKLQNAISHNPFREAENEPKTLHLYFLSEIPKDPNTRALENARVDRKRFVIKDDIFYLYAPDGIGRSRLATNAEKFLGVSATARNWRTVCKILHIAESN